MEKPVGVLGAMEPEIRGLVDALAVEDSGGGIGFEYWSGRLSGQACVVARCGMGKVSAAASVQRLIDRFGVGALVVCGLAGGLQPSLSIGDIVIGDRFVQHDVDASPIFPRFEVPGLGVSEFAADATLTWKAGKAAKAFAEAAGSISDLAAFGIDRPGVHRGRIVTGDQFVKDGNRAALVQSFPDALCVEMEGAAVAQVCYLNDVPFAIVRVISDRADGSAALDFKAFVNQAAPAYAVGIVSHLLSHLDG